MEEETSENPICKPTSDEGEDYVRKELELSGEKQEHVYVEQKQNYENQISEQKEQSNTGPKHVSNEQENTDEQISEQKENKSGEHQHVCDEQKHYDVKQPSEQKECNNVENEQGNGEQEQTSAEHEHVNGERKYNDWKQIIEQKECNNVENEQVNGEQKQTSADHEHVNGERDHNNEKQIIEQKEYISEEQEDNSGFQRHIDEKQGHDDVLINNSVDHSILDTGAEKAHVEEGQGDFGEKTISNGVDPSVACIEVEQAHVEEGQGDSDKKTTSNGVGPSVACIEVEQAHVEEGQGDSDKKTTSNGVGPSVACIEVEHAHVEEGHGDSDKKTTSNGVGPSVACIEVEQSHVEEGQGDSDKKTTSNGVGPSVACIEAEQAHVDKIHVNDGEEKICNHEEPAIICIGIEQSHVEEKQGNSGEEKMYSGGELSIKCTVQEKRIQIEQLYFENENICICEQCMVYNGAEDQWNCGEEQQHSCRCSECGADDPGLPETEFQANTSSPPLVKLTEVGLKFTNQDFYWNRGPVILTERGTLLWALHHNVCVEATPHYEHRWHFELRITDVTRNTVIAVNPFIGSFFFMANNGAVEVNSGFVRVTAYDKRNKDDKYTLFIIRKKEILFTSRHSKTAFSLRETGITTRLKKCFIPSYQDISYKIFDICASCTPESKTKYAMKTLRTMKYAMTPRYTQMWRGRGVIISYTSAGELKVETPSMHVKLSPEGRALLTTNNLHVTSSSVEHPHLYVSVDKLRMYYDGINFINRNASQAAGLDRFGKITIFNSGTGNTTSE